MIIIILIFGNFELIITIILIEAMQKNDAIIERCYNNVMSMNEDNVDIR